MQYLKTAPTNINQGVATKHDDYLKFAEKWQRCRDVADGSDAVKQKGTDYLPKLSSQDAMQYIAYVIRANFYNATNRTISGLVGMLFRKPPVKDTPTALDNLLTNIDMNGTPFDMFSQLVCQEVLTVNRVGILVDYAKYDANSQPVLTQLAAEKMNLRPTLKMYCTESIINWKFENVNNVYTLTQLVLQENFTFPKLNASNKPSEWEQQTELRWRVLDIYEGKYRQRVFHKVNGIDTQVDGDIYPLMNNQPLAFIPFFCITQDGVSWLITNPPLLDLVDVNLSHYNTSADYENGCHFTGVPTFYIAGYQEPVPTGNGTPAKIALGSENAIILPNPEGKVGFAEFTGTGLGSLVANLDRKEQQMAILGARMLATEGKQAQTATTTAIHRTGENSVLSSISIAVSLGLSRALSVFSAWFGYPTECKIDLNKDFLPVTVDGPTLTAVMASWQAGGLSDQEFFDWMQRGDLIEAEIDFDAHKAMTFQDPTKLLAPPATKPDATGKPAIPANPEKP